MPFIITVPKSSSIVSLVPTLGAFFKNTISHFDKRKSEKNSFKIVVVYV